MANLPEEQFQDARPAPAILKARIYSGLVLRQGQSGPLASLTASKERGQKLCVFEQLVQIVPVDETVKSLNICRVCYARVLAEHFETPPIYWTGCPYVEFRSREATSLAGAQNRLMNPNRFWKFLSLCCPGGDK